jgi:hypothetical protein
MVSACGRQETERKLASVEGQEKLRMTRRPELRVETRTKGDVVSGASAASFFSFSSERSRLEQDGQVDPPEVSGKGL